MGRWPSGIGAAIHYACGCDQSANAGTRCEACCRAARTEWLVDAGSSHCAGGYGLQKDIDDLRESPALDVFRLLEAAGANVVFTDPMVSVFRKEDGTTAHAQPASPALWAGLIW
ncbi:UDP binding domain-containing protein [Paenibacillus sp. 1A_MP2]|uniref:UDP binding domain-containing protein n=1 Tax=Paenibacillus sp. 1A_MP2 TaxID=3457495 RepID=UPI003FCDAC6D